MSYSYVSRHRASYYYYSICDRGYYMHFERSAVCYFERNNFVYAHLSSTCNVQIGGYRIAKLRSILPMALGKPVEARTVSCRTISISLSLSIWQTKRDLGARHSRASRGIKSLSPVFGIRNNSARWTSLAATREVIILNIGWTKRA